MTPRDGTQCHVVSVSRRRVTAEKPDGSQVEALLPSSLPDVVCGDEVKVVSAEDTPIIASVVERKNLLLRRHQNRSKLLAANLDCLFIVNAVAPLFNPVFIDRTIASCEAAQIPFVLVVNKRDLGLEDTLTLIQIYKQLDITVIITCAKEPDGMTDLEQFLKQPSLKVCALCGISGVGKSSLLNRLIPGALRSTGAVSTRTGQGKQTTSLAASSSRVRDDGSLQRIIDLPGLQHFGISHLSLQALPGLFREFVTFSRQCKYLDCTHTGEPQCGVRAAIQEGVVSTSRYESYIGMREELLSVKPY